MIQQKTIDLRAHRLSESDSDRLAWHPGSQKYLTRVLIALGLCLLTGFLWLAPKANPCGVGKRSLDSLGFTAPSVLQTTLPGHQMVLGCSDPFGYHTVNTHRWWQCFGDWLAVNGTRFAFT